jgi:predicted AAA+ superfamily ATPase
MTDVYHRTALAQQMAQQLLEPKVLDLPLRSGLFLSGLRRTGKTAFLRQDLIPALEKGEWGPGEDGRPAMVTSGPM